MTLYKRHRRDRFMYLNVDILFWIWIIHAFRVSAVYSVLSLQDPNLFWIIDFWVNPVLGKNCPAVHAPCLRANLELFSHQQKKMCKVNYLGTRNPRLPSKSGQWEEKHPTYSDLVVSCLSHVSYPLDWLVVVLLKHLQEPDQQSRRRKHQHLEIHRDWWSGPCLLVRHCRQICLTRQHVFRLTLESSNPMRMRELEGES